MDIIKRSFWAEFAKAAVTGIEASGSTVDYDEVAEWAANLADALLAQMDKRKFPDEVLASTIGSDVRRRRSVDKVPRGLERYTVAELLGLSIRSANCIVTGEIYSVADLVKLTPRDLLKIKHFGRKSLAEVTSALKRKGLALQPDPYGFL
ncbi:hypothetical protein LCGC14_1613760 [marine sediment metagenome]|uniref:RNA polymerase alpha subunit C-terminal domain-containing protein n=1 Tax=marine sediment metagenome TaxID=412755 RepID=A0A0F9L7P0_9ZZZZ